MRKTLDLWWWYAGGAGGDSSVAGGKVQAPAFGVGRGKGDTGRGRGRGKGKKAGGGGVPPQAKVRLSWPQRSVPLAALQWVSQILEVLVWRCRARLPNVLASFMKCLMTARLS